VSFETNEQPTSQPVLLPSDLEALPVSTTDEAELEEQCIVGFNSRDIRSRPFNLLRTQVLRKMRERKWKILAVTSDAPNAGKSFVTTNLAAAMGQLADVKVMALDLDLRRASLGSRMGVNADKGMSDYLNGSVDRVADLGVRVQPLNIALFPSSPASINSAELLVGPRIKDLFASIRALPDDYIVLIDLPPVFANDDAMAVMQLVDAYMFVIEEGVTTQRQVRDAMNLLNPVECIGAVLNRYVEQPGDSYGYSGNYERYYT
jgi:protein-tyrosine kinase